MDGPESSWDAEQEADDGEDLMFLVHQVWLNPVHSPAPAVLLLLGGSSNGSSVHNSSSTASSAWAHGCTIFSLQPFVGK